MGVSCRTNFVGEERHLSRTLSAWLNLRRSQKAPWCPSFSLAVRILLLVRFAAAMYSNIQDCDEGMRSRGGLRCSLTHRLVFNFWEPLHYLDRGHGFQTWETSPVYAIRSYAYIALHLIPVKIARLLFGDEKVCCTRWSLYWSLILHTIEDCILCPPGNPISRVNSLRGKTLSDGSREGQLACGEVHVLHDAYEFRDVECFSGYVKFSELTSVVGP